VSESPFVEILLTKLHAQELLEVLPPCEERQRLQARIRACTVALNFLRATLADLW
jgi:hypothetical protein